MPGMFAPMVVACATTSESIVSIRTASQRAVDRATCAALNAWAATSESWSTVRIVMIAIAAVSADSAAAWPGRRARIAPRPEIERKPARQKREETPPMSDLLFREP